MKTIDIWVLVFPGFVLLDATGPVQVFATANDEARDAGQPEPYLVRMMSPAVAAALSCSVVSVLTEPLPRGSLAGATLIVSGGRGMELASTAFDPAAMRWIARAAGRLARCCSVCTGAFA